MAGFGVMAALLAFVELRADQVPEFAFDHAIVFVRVFDDFPADFDVLLKRFVAGVDHHAGEPLVDAVLAKLERIAVVEVNGDGDVGKADGRLDELIEIDGIGVLARSFRDLEHHRRLLLFASLDDGLQHFHIVDVESSQRVFPLERFGEKFPCVCQWHSCSLSDSIDCIRTQSGNIIETLRLKGK
jgi:hypothetical protein